MRVDNREMGKSHLAEPNQANIEHRSLSRLVTPSAEGAPSISSADAVSGTSRGEQSKTPLLYRKALHAGLPRRVTQIVTRLFVEKLAYQSELVGQIGRPSMPWSEGAGHGSGTELALQDRADLRELTNVRDQSLRWPLSDGGGGRPVIGSWRGLQSSPEQDASHASVKGASRSTASIPYWNSEDRPRVRFQCLRLAPDHPVPLPCSIDRACQRAFHLSICLGGRARRADLLIKIPIQHSIEFREWVIRKGRAPDRFKRLCSRRLPLTSPSLASSFQACAEFPVFGSVMVAASKT